MAVVMEETEQEIRPEQLAPPALSTGDERAARFIDVRGLEKTFSGDGAPVCALRGLELVVPEGTFLGVMGQSGSGKSTFLSILGGLSHPSAGSISVDGIDLYALGGEKLADFRREYLGFVFQSFNLVPYLTALENVMLPLVAHSAEVAWAPLFGFAAVVLAVAIGGLAALYPALHAGKMDPTEALRAL